MKVAPSNMDAARHDENGVRNSKGAFIFCLRLSVWAKAAMHSSVDPATGPRLYVLGEILNEVPPMVIVTVTFVSHGTIICTLVS